MTILNFNLILNNYLHISNIRKLYKHTHNFYKIINNSYIINIIYISSNLYKLYKIIFLLSIKKTYITFISTLKTGDYKFINYLLKFTNHNFFNKLWVKGLISNKIIIPNLILIYIFITKVYYTSPTAIKNKKFNYINNKYKFIKSLKNVKFSKFIFFLNLDLNVKAIKESITLNKFIMGLCDLNFDTSLVNYAVCCNNINYKSINFILQLILTSTIHGQKFTGIKKKIKKLKK